MKEELEKYLKYKAEIDINKASIKRLERQDIKISGSNFSINGGIRSKGQVSNSIENQVIKSNDEILELTKEIELLEAKIKMIDSLIKTLKKYQQEIVISFYIENKQIPEIAEERSRTQKTISRVLRKSIKYMDKIYTR